MGWKTRREAITPEGRPAAYVSFESYNHSPHFRSGEPFFFSSGQIQGLRPTVRCRLRLLSLPDSRLAGLTVSLLTDFLEPGHSWGDGEEIKPEYLGSPRIVAGWCSSPGSCIAGHGCWT